jgi:Ceramidase
MGWNGLLWAGLAGLVLPLILLVVVVVAGGPPDDCVDRTGPKPFDKCYCESFSDGPLKQPANTLSNLGSILIGAGLLAYVALAEPRRDNPMTADPWIAFGYGALTIFLGTGSMFLHASMSRVGGWFDNISMDVYITFILVYNVVRLNNWGRLAFWISYVVLNVLLLVLTYPTVIEGSGKVFFGVFIGLTLLTELQINLPVTIPSGRGPVFMKTLVVGIERSPWWLLAGLGAFGLAFVIWIASQTGGALCTDPDSAFQWHGVWHVLSGAAAGCFFFYFRSEKRLGLPYGPTGW